MPEKGKGVVYAYADGVRVIHGGGGGVTFHGPKGTITVNRGPTGNAGWARRRSAPITPS